MKQAVHRAVPGSSPTNACTPVQLRGSYLLPANEVCEGYVFTDVCLSTPGGACMVLFGGVCVVLFRGACMVLFGGHAWFYSGGACMVLFGGHAWFYSGGHAWFYLGGMRGCSQGGMRGCSGGACVVARGCVRGFFNEIWSMSGRYASYWNAFLFDMLWQPSWLLSGQRVSHQK